MKFLTGGTGFIGAHLLYHLASNGHEVVAMKRPTSDTEYVRRVFEFYSGDNVQHLEKVHWVDGNILDQEWLVEATRDADEIWHSAAMVSFDSRDHDSVLITNVRGTANVVNAALEHGIQKVAYISSVAALDPVREGQVVKEEHFGNFPQRNSYYAESKFQSELEIWRGVEEGLDAVVVNPSVVLGPCIPINGPGAMFKMLRKGIGFYPSGTTGFVDVRDVCRILYRLMEENIVNDRFIVSEGNHSYRELFQLIAGGFGSMKPNRKLKPFITALAWRLDLVRSSLFHKKPLITKELHQAAHREVHFSNEKIREKLNYQFMPLQQTLEDTINAMD